MTALRKICVLTGTRADYGLLRHLILEIEHSHDAELQLVVSGTHLNQEHGRTSSEISDDALVAALEVPVWSGDDSAAGAAQDTGAAVGSFARALNALDPDIVVVLGDRLEALAMATAATVMSVPIAHIHGGEITEGAMDDAMRHAITKMSYLHFASTEEHRRRVIQLGEEPNRVFNVGAPIVDAISSLRLLDPAALEARFGVRLDRTTALVTFHPAAMDVLPPLELLGALLSALHEIPDLNMIITGTNSDIGSADVRSAIRRFVLDNPERVDYVESFGQLGYLSTMAQVGVVVGNSSSTVLEAPVLQVPSVLVGDRQAGRPISPSVIVPEPSSGSIASAIRRALSPGFRDAVRGAPLPFGEPGFAKRTLDIILERDIPRPPRKRFWDTENGES